MKRKLTLTLAGISWSGWLELPPPARAYWMIYNEREAPGLSTRHWWGAVEKFSRHMCTTYVAAIGPFLWNLRIDRFEDIKR